MYAASGTEPPLAPILYDLLLREFEKKRSDRDSGSGQIGTNSGFLNHIEDTSLDTLFTNDQEVPKSHRALNWTAVP